MEDKGHSLLVKIAKKLKALNPLQKTIEKWQESRALRIKREASLRGPHIQWDIGDAPMSVKNFQTNSL